MDQSQDLKTGTTTVGVIAKDAIILAADMRASMGHLAYDEEADKLYKITENIALSNAGSVGDSLAMIRFLRSHAYLYEIERETKISPKAISSYLSNILNANRHYPYIVQFLIAGFNDSADIYELTPYGGVLRRDKYAVTGSGSELALATIDDGYKKDMSEEEAIALAVKAVSAAKKRDLYTGGVSISIMVIRRDGIEELKRSEVEKYIANKATNK